MSHDPDYPPEAAPSAIVISKVTNPGPVSGLLYGYDWNDQSVIFALASGGTPAHGTVSISLEGTYIYTPHGDYLGSDSFAFTVTTPEDGKTTSATVSITIVTEAPATIEGASGDDVLIGGNLDNVIDGLGGNDVLMGGGGDDILTGSSRWEWWGSASPRSARLFGGGGNDVLNITGIYGGFASGDAGNDTLNGGSGNDTLYGGVGSDRIVGAAGNDWIGLGIPELGDYADGGEGQDVLELSGTSGNDTVLVSDSGAVVNGLSFGSNFEGFVFSGGGGNDTLTGGSGNDVLYDGTGVDRLMSGEGDDTVEITGLMAGDFADGGAGSDTIHVHGQSTNDAISVSGLGVVANGISIGSGFEKHIISGQGGNDTLTGGAGFESLFGGLGSDTLRTGEGGGNAFGDAGDDSITGGSGSEGLWGGDGNDTLNTASGGGHAFGEAGNDTLIGGSGNDYLRDGSGIDRITAGDGDDNVQIDGLAMGDFADGGVGKDGLYISGGSTNDQMLVSGSGAVVNGISIGSNFERLTFVGGDGDDTLTGGSGSENLWGDAGQDSLSTGEGGGTAYAGSGSDVVSGGTGDDALDGGSGNDALSGGDGNDRLYGGNDYYSYYYGGPDTDTLYGGAGNDLLYASGSFAAGTINGGTGNDSLHVSTYSDYDETTASLDNILVQNVEVLSVEAEFISGTAEQFDAFATIIDAWGGLNLGLTGSADLSDELGNQGTYVSIRSLGGGVTTGSGNDQLYGSNGNDTLNGGLGSDWLNGAGGADLLNGATGDDQVFGEDGHDTLSGEAGNDTLSGGSGNDRLGAGTGVDQLSGGDGNDTLTFNGVEAGDVADGGIGTDFLWLTGGAANDAIAVSSTGTGAHFNSLAIGTGFERFQFYGADGHDTLTGAVAADLLYGGNGDDRAFGGGGNDTLFGEAGSDTLDGGSGNDRLDGGAGNDVFVVDSTGDVVVEAASGGTDRINSTVTLTSLSAQVENVTLLGTAALTVIGNSLNNELIGNAGANSLNGGAGNDVITGGVGADTVVGGTGNDLYVVEDAGDTIVEVASGGTDQVNASVSLILAAEVENLVLRGTAALNGTGNVLANQITGNTGANSLNGLGGNDTLSGDAGADRLLGDVGNDTLRGGTGNDTLTGGTGADHFVFDVAATTANGSDRVIDLVSASDRLVFEDAVFTKLLKGDTAGHVLTTQVRFGTAAADSNDFLVYTQSTGQLYYDADGSGAGATVLVATLNAGQVLAAGDLFVM